MTPAKIPLPLKAESSSSLRATAAIPVGCLNVTERRRDAESVEELAALKAF